MTPMPKWLAAMREHWDRENEVTAEKLLRWAVLGEPPGDLDAEGWWRTSLGGKTVGLVSWPVETFAARVEGPFLRVRIRRGDYAWEQFVDVLLLTAMYVPSEAVALMRVRFERALARTAGGR